MALSFSASVNLNILRVQQEINDRVYRITLELFLSVVRRTPSPDHPGPHAIGLLANQWYPKVGGGYNDSVGTTTSPNGAGSMARILALHGGTEFLGKNGKITLANNLHYAYRAEVLGWPTKDGWSGKSGADGAGGPYRMVALALQEIAARYK